MTLSPRIAAAGLVAMTAIAGCAQITGLGADYHGRASAGGTGGAGGTAGSGGTGGTAGAAGGGTGGTAGGSGGAAGASGAPSLVGHSEFHDSANGADSASSHLADATFQKPAGTQEGDFILVFFGADHLLNSLDPATLGAKGWTLDLAVTQYGTDGQAAYLIHKFASASEPASIVFSAINNTPSGDGVQGLLTVYRGVDPVTPINALQKVVENTGATNTTHVQTPTPAITTTVPNCLAIAGFSPDSAIDAPVIATWPDGFTRDQFSVVNPVNPLPYGWANIYSAERALPTAGALPASQFTWDMTNATEYYGALTFVLALAPAG